MRKIMLLLLSVTLVLSSCTFLGKKVNSEAGDKPISQQQSTNTNNQNSEEKKVETGTFEGQMAPDFALKNIDGKEVKLSDFKGKTVVLNFFGVWCAWCKVEMPGFMNVYNEYKGKNVELLVVDSGDNKDTVVKYLKENKYDIKPVMDSEDKISRLYGVRGFPTTFIIDEKGIIKNAHTGYMEEKILRSLLVEFVK